MPDFTGLHMIININQDEYVKEVGDTAGIRMVIHSQNRMPFPEDEGITVSPGHSTSIGLRQVLINRLSHPHGNCTHPDNSIVNNVFAENYPVEYSTTVSGLQCTIFLTYLWRSLHIGMSFRLCFVVNPGLPKNLLPNTPNRTVPVCRLVLPTLWSCFQLCQCFNLFHHQYHSR